MDIVNCNQSSYQTEDYYIWTYNIRKCLPQKNWKKLIHFFLKSGKIKKCKNAALSESTIFYFK